MAHGNRAANTLDIGTLNRGDVVTVITEHSRWEFVITHHTKFQSVTATGVAVMTNSRGFGHMTKSLVDVRITRNFVLGREVSINDGNTSAILTVLVNGVRRLG
jgi:hypothetical protein